LVGVLIKPDPKQPAVSISDCGAGVQRWVIICDVQVTFIQNCFKNVGRILHQMVQFKYGIGYLGRMIAESNIY